MAKYIKAAIVLSVLLTTAQSVRAAEVSFAKDVWPIFRTHCWSCHSGNKPEGKLRLDGEEHLRQGGESGSLFEAGKPAESLLIEQVTGVAPSMPPKQPPLKAAEVDVLRRWIAAGGKVDSMPVDDSARVVIPPTYDFAPSITAVAFDLRGERVAAACRSEVVVVSLNTDAKPLRLATECDLVAHVEYSPDGKLLLAAGGSPARYGEVRWFDAESGKLVGSRRLSDDTFFRGSFSPDGKTIALGGADGAVYLVPLDVKADVRRLELHSDWVVDVAWTPDGTKVITAGRDKSTKVASVKTGELLRTIDSSLERTNSVVSDDAFAVSGGLTRAVTAYQLAVALQSVEVAGAGNGARPVSRREQYVRAVDTAPGEVLDIALSGDRKTLAVVGRFAEVRLFTLATQQKLPVVSKLTAPVYAVALDEKGLRVAIGTRAGRLEVYEVATGKQLKSLVPVPLRESTAAR